MADGIQLNKGYDGDLLDAWDDTENARKIQRIIAAESGPCKVPLTQYVDSVGDGSGTIELNVDGTTPVTYMFVPGAAQIARVRALIFTVISATQPEPEEFQDAAALTNGINIFATISTVVHTLCGGVPIKNNAQMSTVFSGAGRGELLSTKKLAVYFLEFLANPLRLVGEDGDFLSVVIQDNLSALQVMYAHVSGNWEK